MVASHEEPSLNEVLEKLGYRTEHAGFYRKHIINVRTNQCEFTGTAGAVWDWLRREGQIK